MMTFLSFLFLSMFLFVNTLYFSMVLLLIVLSLLYSLVSDHMLHSLTMLLLVIVYVGAMMILIGYICAVCPNLILTPIYISLAIYVVFFVLPNTTLPMDYKMVMDQSFIPLVNYFYSSLGMFVFLLLVLMLFVTLLMVTSQYMSPKGPFRSVDV
uniref:NADH dehydrogenase subunit 6 n=1 Tax=Brachionus plicatilis TaxID=10195 RepID=B1GYK4_BRAPC|nr:NADH dehydrogenase subunit 6 [Brachionus plicatilis]BAG12879.1 NADH dehydrogenase subunit 6 [Brachionus plicatilis]